jgi:hypothetical protein
LADLFPDEDYKLQMRFTRGEPMAYFAPTEQHAAIVAERSRWLADSPETYSALLPQGETLMCECAAAASIWNGFEGGQSGGLESCRSLGRYWEADFLLLKAGSDGEIRLLGGCLCFPSHWRLTDKIGKPIEFVHSPVPGLNENLGSSIHKFLAGLKSGIAWQRVNWGLGRSPELNQHPDRHLPRLDANVRLNEIWLRVEEQALVALPESGGILFGIRIVNHALAGLRNDLQLTSRFCRALATMPEDLARYKGLSDARPAILQMLKS